MEKTTHRRALPGVLISRYYLGDIIKKHDLGGACSMHWEEVLVGRQLRIHKRRWV